MARLFVTGASSFVGAHFCRVAAAAGHDVRGLWRNTRLALPGVQGVQGDVTTCGRPEGVDVVVHLAAKVMTQDARAENRAMMTAVLGWRLPVVYGSSTVIHWPRIGDYARARIEDEARLKDSGLPWITVRPCAPYGPHLVGHRAAHVESFHRLADIVRRAPVLPLIGDGRYRRQPVHVDDFSASILGLVERGAWGNALDAGGADPLSMRTILRLMAHAAGRRSLLLPVPARLAALGARLIPGMDPELVATFATDDTADIHGIVQLSGVRPRRFEDGVGCLFPR